MYDLTCIIPLYGNNCSKVSLRMISSLSIQETNSSVMYLFFYDNTVDYSTIEYINMLMRGHSYVLVDCKEKTQSAYKRNQGLNWAIHNSKFVWFIDQDDYLLSPNSIDSFMKLVTPEIKVFKVKFTVPVSLDNENRKIILSTPTMPWQYVFRASELTGYSFDEECEYGSDIPITIRYLAKNSYIEIADNMSINVRNIPTFTSPVYFYNYLNKNSHMFTHAVASKDEQKVKVEKAYNLIKAVKAEVEGQNESN